MFGPERSGLAGEDVGLASSIVTVPINPEFGSLNLAQAVILLAYEWSRKERLEKPTEKDQEPPAPMGKLEGLIGQVDEALDDAGYYFPPERTAATKSTIRTILTKPGWSSREINALRGMLKSLTRNHKA